MFFSSVLEWKKQYIRTKLNNKTESISLTDSKQPSYNESDTHHKMISSVTSSLLENIPVPNMELILNIDIHMLSVMYLYNRYNVCIPYVILTGEYQQLLLDNTYSVEMILLCQTLRTFYREYQVSS